MNKKLALTTILIGVSLTGCHRAQQQEATALVAPPTYIPAQTSPRYIYHPTPIPFVRAVQPTYLPDRSAVMKLPAESITDEDIAYVRWLMQVESARQRMIVQQQNQILDAHSRLIKDYGKGTTAGLSWNGGGSTQLRDPRDIITPMMSQISQQWKQFIGSFELQAAPTNCRGVAASYLALLQGESTSFDNIASGRGDSSQNASLVQAVNDALISLVQRTSKPLPPDIVSFRVVN